ncbi:hypothetical protein [Arthrobacter sp. B1I2]|uniref:hypothetical protein n=1 Tax=Arthrobacter sp. B1I2 TaxID=3042263 RepID=UPI002785DD36|nr:hypothetical protein [Arthrobacter sp. B1I2]MDQ0733458.1 hypothetical protein [Arthrobacter sp. B1I2]
MMPTSSQIFDGKGIGPGDEIEVLDDGLVIARGAIEDLASDQSMVLLKLSYGRGRRTYRREDGWQVRTFAENHEGQL